MRETPFSPTSLLSLPSPHPSLPLPSQCRSNCWNQVICCSAPFVTIQAFFSATAKISLAPEQSSGSILRGEVLQDEVIEEGNEEEIDEHARVDIKGKGKEIGLAGYEDWITRRRLRVRLVPKRTFDEAIEVNYYFMIKDDQALVLLVPELSETVDGPKAPYYHPQVFALAYRYFSTSTSTSASIQIDLIPLLPIAEFNISHRLYRTALSLLTFLERIAITEEVGYEKRMNFDLLVDKATVQNLYLVLKEKYKADIILSESDPRITFRWLLNSWHEDTDPAKHVYEDVAIVAWLITLWRGMYENGMPPGGFVDIGCGNGLLVFILASEGFAGYGLDLRSRKSWPSFRPIATLKTLSLSPLEVLTSSPSFFPAGSFLITNHGDELTPWTPLFAAITPSLSPDLNIEGEAIDLGVPYLSIPCCAHELFRRFTPKDYKIPPSFLSLLPLPLPLDSPPTSTPSPPTPRHSPLLIPFYAPTSSNLHQGRFFAYQLYLAHLALLVGYLPEREALRIPSTKNFGIVGRKRTFDLNNDTKQSEEEKLRVKRYIEDVVRELNQNGWIARTPEGKAGLPGFVESH